MTEAKTSKGYTAARFSVVEVGWADGGPIVDLLSFGDTDSDSQFSVFCLNFTLSPFLVYLELFGQVLIDTYPDED